MNNSGPGQGTKDTNTDLLQRWQALCNEGLRLRLIGEYELAWAQYREAQQLAELEDLTHEALLSRIEVAGAAVKLGLKAEASEILASALSTPGLPDELCQRVNELLSELFEFDGDWTEALNYWNEARPYIDPANKPVLFWWHQQNSDLLIKAGKLAEAEQELKACQEVLDMEPPTRDDGWFADLLLLRRAELEGARGNTHIALKWTLEAQVKLSDQGHVRSAAAAVLARVELLDGAGLYEELIDVVNSTLDEAAGHRSIVRLSRYRSDALQRLGRWEEAAIELDRVIRLERRRETNAHSVYLLQQEIETSAVIRLQNQELEKANQVLLEASTDRSRLMDTIGRELNTQLSAAMTSWDNLQSSESSTERVDYLQQTANSVDQLTATATQIVQVRLLEAKELDLTTETRQLRELLDEATSSIGQGHAVTNNTERSTQITTDSAHFVSAIRHLIAAFTNRSELQAPAPKRSLSFDTVHSGDREGFQANVSGPDLERDLGSDLDMDINLDSAHQDLPANFHSGMINLHLGRELLGYLGFEVTVTRTQDSIAVRAIGPSSIISS